MKPPTLPSNVTYVEGFEPGYLGHLVQMHGEYYAKAWGAGAKYEVQTAQEAAEFCEHYDPEKDLLFTAHIGGKLVGTIAIVGTQAERPGEARLRWFLLEEECLVRGSAVTCWSVRWISVGRRASHASICGLSKVCRARFISM